MSAYQYYEFRAIDRSLSKAEMETLRSFSTRARISKTGFVNDYAYGRFRGNEDTWMEKYFDAFVYLANWGSRRFMLRLPSSVLSARVARSYCTERSLSVSVKARKLILSIQADNEGGGEWIDSEGHLEPLLFLRDELSNGDLRILYLAWLLGVQQGDLAEDAVEPPVPPGLGSLSPALENLVEFLLLDPDLVEAAATASPALGRAVSKGSSKAKRRTVAELLEAGEEHARMENERLLRQKIRKERAAARARVKHLDSLKGTEPSIWDEVGRLINEMDAASYDRALELLVDLRDLAARDDQSDVFSKRVKVLRAAHPSKQALHRRLHKAGL